MIHLRVLFLTTEDAELETESHTAVMLQ